MDKKSKVLVTGGSGLVGKALIHKLKSYGFNKILHPSSKELDLRNQETVNKYFKKNEIDYVIHLAANVGGHSTKKSMPVNFFYDNVIISCNVISAAKEFNVKKLVNMGSVCIYSPEIKQPYKEESLLMGKLEPINEAYGLAKIVGLKLCEYNNIQFKTNFISLVPCNLYGPGDNFKSDPHLIAKIILKMHYAKINNLPEIRINSSGKVKREFLFVGDLVDAIIYFIRYKKILDLRTFMNIGSGEEIALDKLALLMKKIIGYDGNIKFDSGDGNEIPRRLLNIDKAVSMGWKPKTSLKDGLTMTYSWFIKNLHQFE